MPLFFFNIYNSDVTIDEEGQDCADAAAAHHRAIVEARNLACDTIQSLGTLNLCDQIVILDAERQQIATVTFDEAIKIVG